MTRFSHKYAIDKRGPLNVMFLLTSVPVGGAETLLVNLIRRMDRNRFLPQVCCMKERGPLGEELSNEIPVHFGLINHKYDVAVVNRLQKLMRDQQVDAVITVGAGDKMFWGRLAARRARVPVILAALHSTGWPDGVGKLNRLLTRITDGFVAVAKQHASFLVEIEKFPKNKVFTIANGIDTNRFHFHSNSRQEIRRKMGLKESDPVVGIVAALRPEKNHQLFLLAAKRTLETIPNAQFVIVGDGPLMEELVEFTRRNELTNHVQFTGSRSDIPAILSAIDLFSLTSRNEASPVSILEAMACECPVVAPEVGSIHESVLHRETGFIVPPNQVQPVVERWVELLSDLSRAKQMGQFGRKHVTEKGSLETMTRGYENLVSSIYTAKCGGCHEFLDELLPSYMTHEMIEHS